MDRTKIWGVQLGTTLDSVWAWGSKLKKSQGLPELSEFPGFDDKGVLLQRQGERVPFT